MSKDRDATIDLLKSWGSRQGTKRAYEAVQLAIKHMKGNTLSAEHERLRPKKKKKKGSAEERLAKMRAGSKRKKG